MQFILTKEEYEKLEEIKFYDNLLESVDATAENVVKAICLLDGSPMAYCDKCPIARLRIRERYTNVSFCRKSKHFSK